LRVRDLRLPQDILLVAIIRDGQSFVPHGHSVIHLHDQVTLLGSKTSLETVVVRLGY